MTTTTHAPCRFGVLLAGLRAATGWSQSMLAVEAGYDSSYVTRLEAGTRAPSRDTVGALAAVLGLDTQDTRRLYVAADLLPPGVWVVRHNALVPGGDA